MGVGKTSVGTRLATLLSFDFVDLDAVVVATVGRTVKDIFAVDGEAEFRRFETEALRQIANRPRCVVATGGGVVISELNRRIMHASGTIVLLTATTASVMQRLSGDTSRPLLNSNNPEHRITELLAERMTFYADADFTIVTDGKAVDGIADEIFARIHNNL
jgi:shikimate kinase